MAPTSLRDGTRDSFSGLGRKPTRPPSIAPVCFRARTGLSVAARRVLEDVSEPWALSGNCNDGFMICGNMTAAILQLHSVGRVGRQGQGKSWFWRWTHDGWLVGWLVNWLWPWQSSSNSFFFYFLFLSLFVVWNVFLGWSYIQSGPCLQEGREGAMAARCSLDGSLDSATAYQLSGRRPYPSCDLATELPVRRVPRSNKVDRGQQDDDDDDDPPDFDSLLRCAFRSAQPPRPGRLAVLSQAFSSLS